MPRFDVGKQYCFIDIDYTPAERFSIMYAPWQDTLNEIKVVVLTCAEVHKVQEEWDPKNQKVHDGFIFRGDDDVAWHNQYPVASFGQMDDSQNWVVRKHLSKSELSKLNDHDVGVLWRGMTEACVFIDRILRATNPKSAFGYLGDDKVEEIAALKDFQEKVISKVEAVTGRKIEIGPLVMKDKEGNAEVLPNILTASLLEGGMEATAA